MTGAWVCMCGTKDRCVGAWRGCMCGTKGRCVGAYGGHRTGACVHVVEDACLGCIGVQISMYIYYALYIYRYLELWGACDRAYACVHSCLIMWIC